MDGHRVVDVFVVVRYAVTRSGLPSPVYGLRQTARWPTRTRSAEAKKKEKNKKTRTANAACLPQGSGRRTDQSNSQNFLKASSGNPWGRKCWTQAKRNAVLGGGSSGWSLGDVLFFFFPFLFSFSFFKVWGILGPPHHVTGVLATEAKRESNKYF